jgi:aryl-alcohol dehydrogenase-like predicted oxidoreductase
MRITLPPLGFGGAPLGNMFQPLDEATADATLKAAWEAGIRYYDTSPHYGAGLAEQRFGRLLSHKPRDEFVLSTKVGRLLQPAAAPENAKPFVDESWTTPPMARAAPLKTVLSAWASIESMSPSFTTCLKTNGARSGPSTSSRPCRARRKP